MAHKPASKFNVLDPQPLKAETDMKAEALAASTIQLKFEMLCKILVIFFAIAAMLASGIQARLNFFGYINSGATDEWKPELLVLSDVKASEKKQGKEKFGYEILYALCLMQSTPGAVRAVPGAAKTSIYPPQVNIMLPTSQHTLRAC